MVCTHLWHSPGLRSSQEQQECSKSVLGAAGVAQGGSDSATGEEVAQGQAQLRMALRGHQVPAAPLSSLDPQAGSLAHHRQRKHKIWALL